MATVVSYIKHFDANTKGYIEFGFDDATQGLILAQRSLVNEAVQDEGIDLSEHDGFDSLFTITKVEVDQQSTNWVGV